MSDTRANPHVVHYQRSGKNWGSRPTITPSLIVVHATESTNVPGSSTDLVNVSDWLARVSTKADVHVIVDGDGNSARLVPDGRKAWHVAGYNGYALGIEQVGRAAQTSWSRDELREAARWIARWSAIYRIPIRHGAVTGGRVVSPGVVRHSELGVIGGNHDDPGAGYPLATVLGLATYYRSRIHRSALV